MGWLTTDPHLPYRPVAGSHIRGRSKTDEYDYDHRHNSHGFRDVERALDKPAGVFRILGLGDSFTAGWGAAFEETYLRRAEHALNARADDHPAVEIVKAGINGYYAEPQRLLLEHYGLRFDPDLVLVGFVANDVLDTHRGLGALRVSKEGYLTSEEAARLGETGVRLYRNSHVARIVLRAWVERAHRARPADWWMRIYQPDAAFEQAWRELEGEYDRMLALTTAHGARLVVLYVPSEVPDREFHSYPPERMGRWCASRGVPFIDPSARVRAAADAMLYWPRDRHCTPAGYGVIAEALVEGLLENGLVP